MNPAGALLTLEIVDDVDYKAGATAETDASDPPGELPDPEVEATDD